MPLVRPRLTDHYNIGIAQAECDFAIPLLDEDLPLYADPFLLWNSPSLQDNALHATVVQSFNHLLKETVRGNVDSAAATLARLSECREAGLGSSSSREGRRISVAFAKEMLTTLIAIPEIAERGVSHLEAIALLIDGIGKDRISDFTCSILKSFLIDYSIDQAARYAIPTSKVVVDDILNIRSGDLSSEEVDLPLSPENGRGVLLIPKRWLRYSPWISTDAYFAGGFVSGLDAPKDRVSVLHFNRANYGLVERFVSQREAMATSCQADEIFKPMSVLSAKRRMARLRKLPSGKQDKADKEYEDLVGSLLASVLYPHLDFAASQVRTDSGALIRDVVFYNTRIWDFLHDIHQLYHARQLVFELKNVASLDREHVNQLNRYLNDQIGHFGVLVTRTAPSRSIQRNLVDLWAGQRRCIIVLTDEDIADMVSVFESRQRLPVEVVKRSYVNFTRSLPS